MMQGALPVAREEEEDDWGQERAPASAKEAMMLKRERLIREEQYPPNDPLIL
jgi:hypothetical protein